MVVGLEAITEMWGCAGAGGSYSDMGEVQGLGGGYRDWEGV